MAEEKKIIFEFEVNNKDANAKLDEIAKALEANATAQKNLANAYATGAKTQEQYNKEQKALATEQKGLNNTLRDLERGTKQYANTLQGQRDRLADLKKEWANTNLTTQEGKERFAQLSKEIGELNTKVLDQEKAVGTFTRQVGNYPKAFDGLTTAIDGATNGIITAGKAFLANPIGAVIAGIVAAFALLNKAIESNDELATGWKGLMTGIGIVLDNIFNAIATGITYVLEFGQAIGENGLVGKALGYMKTAITVLLAPLNFMIDLLPAIGKILEGDFSGALDVAGNAVNRMVTGQNTLFEAISNTTDAIREQIQAGVAYEKALDSLEQKQKEFLVTEGQLINQRDRLRLQAKDITKTEEERIALLGKADKIEKKILNERLRLLDAEIGINDKYAKTLDEGSSKREEIEFKLLELQRARLDAENEALRFEEKIINERNKLREKELEEEEKRRAKEEADRLAEQKRQEEYAMREAEALKQLASLETSIEKDKQKEIFSATDKAQQERLKALKEYNRLVLEEEEKQTEALLASEGLTQAERDLIIANSQKKRLDISKDLAIQEQKIVKDSSQEEIDTTKQTNDALLALNASFFSGAQALAQGNEEVEKALGITSALINTAVGVTKALATLPPPASFITATATGLAGAAQVAAISAAAGGGDFVTTKPTLLLVGDNPGGRERVSVTPLSGRGKTTISRDSGMIAMAGGGTITTGSANASSQIDNEIMSTKMLAQTLMRMPAPKVDVRDIVKTTKRVQVKERTSRL